jgi:hypothetical protein
VLGFTLLLLFTVWATFVPASFDIAMVIALPGRLFAMAWNVLVARRLFQLAQGTVTHKTQPGTPQGAISTTQY